MEVEKKEEDCGSCCRYTTPLEAMKSPREKLLYVTCLLPYPKCGNRGDYLSTVDVDPDSPTYSQVIHRLEVPNVGDELHHTGWNVCSSCTIKGKRRDFLIMPCLNSDRIYVVNIGASPRAPFLRKVIEGETLHTFNVSAPHTSHCLSTGEIMISTMGDRDAKAKGSFILLDGDTFDVKEHWERSDCAKWGYDFWYQPRFNVLISSSWGPPFAWRNGFDPDQIPLYGTVLYVWDFKERVCKKTLNLGSDGIMPLEVRFLHDPTKDYGYVGCALSSNVFKFYLNHDTNEWEAKKVISVKSKPCKYWMLPEMPGLITDIIISMDDKFLYFSNWLHGDIRQYDITDSDNPKLVGQIFLGGSCCKGGAVVLTDPEDIKTQPELKCIQKKPIRGGPQMLQLSLDGHRLYATTSLESAWDKQFYPETARGGSMMLQIDVNTEKGGLTLNQRFLVDFGCEPCNPALAHEMRFRNGDCSSDIFY